MRKKFILDTRSKRGITLVSLVVTIIVLLILAGITINLIIGEDGIIRRAQQAGKNYIDAAENEKVQLVQFTNEMDNIIGGSTNSGRTPYNSAFRKNVVEAIKNAGVATTENDTDETIVANIGKILKEKTKDATATADNISEGKTAWVNGELITGNGKDNEGYAEVAHSFIAFGVGKTGRDTITSSIYQYNSEYISVSSETATVIKPFTATVQLVDSGLVSSWVRFYRNGNIEMSGTGTKQISFSVGDTFYSQSWQDPSLNYSGSSFIIYK